MSTTGRKTPLTVALEGGDAELREFLLARPTCTDTAWVARAGKPSRFAGERREEYIRRVTAAKDYGTA